MNEVRFGYTRRHVERAALLPSSPPSESLDILGIPSNGAFNNEFPTFLISGLQQLRPPANTDSSFRTGVTEIADTASWQHGRHTIKFGIDNRISRLDVLQPSIADRIVHLQHAVHEYERRNRDGNLAGQSGWERKVSMM